MKDDNTMAFSNPGQTNKGIIAEWVDTTHSALFLATANGKHKQMFIIPSPPSLTSSADASITVYICQPTFSSHQGFNWFSLTLTFSKSVWRRSLIVWLKHSFWRERPCYECELVTEQWYWLCNVNNRMFTPRPLWLLLYLPHIAGQGHSNDIWPVDGHKGHSLATPFILTTIYHINSRNVTQLTV